MIHVRQNADIPNIVTILKIIQQIHIVWGRLQSLDVLKS